MKKISLFLIVIVMVLLSTACSKDAKIEENTKLNFVKDMVELDISESEAISHMIAFGEKYMIRTWDYRDEGGSRIYSGKEAALDEMKLISEPDGETMIPITMDKDGNWYWITKKEKGNGYEITKIDINGEMEKQYSLETDVDFVDAQTDDTGNLYLLSIEHELYIFEFESQKLTKLAYDGLIQEMSKDRDGNLVLFATTSTLKEFVYRVNTDKMTLEEYVELDVDYFSGTKRFANSEKYNFCFYNDIGLWGYTEKENRIDKILDFNDLNINSVSCVFVGQMPDGAYYYFEYDATSNKNQLYALRESDSTDRRESLYLVGISIPSIIQKAVFEFNQQNVQYKIIVNDFERYGEEAEKKLAMVLNEGKEVDILCLNQLNVREYMEKGILADLYQFTDYQKKIETDVLLPEIKKVIQKEEGLYYVTPGFTIKTAITRDAELIDEMKLNSTKALELLKKNQRIERVSNLSREAFFETLCVDNFLKDIEQTKNILTDKECLIRFLQLAESIPEQSEEITIDKLLESNSLITNLMLVDFNDFLAYSRMYGESANYIGSISETGSGCCMKDMGMSIGVYANTSNKSGAIAFVEMILSKQFQQRNCYPNFFPTNKECMEAIIQATMNTEEYLDESGNKITPYACEISYDDYNTVITAMTEEEKVQFMELIQKLEEEVRVDDDLLELIHEEAQTYFEGNVELDIVVKNLQNRVNTYVKENE